MCSCVYVYARASERARAHIYMMCMCGWMESCIFNVCSYKFIFLPLFLPLSRSVYTSSLFSRHFCASGFLSVKQCMQQRACLIISINFTDMPHGYSTKHIAGIGESHLFTRARARSYSSDRTLLSALRTAFEIFSNVSYVRHLSFSHLPP